MATERLLMHQIKEVLRAKWECGRSNRAIAASVRISAGSVSNIVSAARARGLASFADVAALDDDQLNALLFPERTKAAEVSGRTEPDCTWIHRERSRPGVTLELLHHEYLEQHADGLRYSAFCDRYRAFLKRRGLSMRQVHIAGDKVFVDYSGVRPHLVDATTGEVTHAELFVAVLGASNYTYAEATHTQRVHDFLASHDRAFKFFDGVPAATVPDNLKSGITKACFYEPTIQRSYQSMAEHFGTAILPARAGKPRDKAKVEVGVQIAQRWILARLRNRVFNSLRALNEAIRTCVDDLNRRTMRAYGKSRLELYAQLEKPALRPLPSDAFVLVEWKKARVNIDYHVEFGGRLYSVPHRFVHEEVWLRATNTTVEILLRAARIAAHARHGRDRHATIPEHMPSSHRAHAEWTPSRILSWAATVGPSTQQLCSAILTERPHPEQGFRSCLGVLRLAKKYGNERLEAACARCVAVRARSYRSVESVLRHGLDRLDVSDVSDVANAPLDHENVRGRDYFVN